MPKIKNYLEKTIDTGPSATSDVPTQKTLENSSFSSWSRGISPAELKKPEVAKAIAKMLLAQSDNLQKEVQRYRSFEEKFHQVDKIANILKERIKGLRRSIGMRIFLFSVGFGTIGFSQFFWENYKPVFFIMLAVGVILVFIGYFLKETSDNLEN